MTYRIPQLLLAKLWKHCLSLSLVQHMKEVPILYKIKISGSNLDPKADQLDRIFNDFTVTRGESWESSFKYTDQINVVVRNYTSVRQIEFHEIEIRLS